MGNSGPCSKLRIADSLGDKPARATPVPPLGAVSKFGRVLAHSAPMREVLGALQQLAPSDVTVALLGETGSGKDVLARAIHDESPRAAGPFVVIDCGSLAATLAESELLGHERGAFTGAVGAHAGAFERANGGTVFLDEIAELPLELQPRLLRALESRRVRRVGGRIDHPIDVRVVAATNRDLHADVLTGRFRQDLFFRLAVAVVEVPPLRRRLEDLPELAQGILADLGRPEVRLSEAALASLRAHAWPGNARELKNALSRALAFADRSVQVLEPRHFRLIAPVVTRADSSTDLLPLGGRALEEIERSAIRQTLLQTGGDKVTAARLLGIALSTLYDKLRKYDP